MSVSTVEGRVWGAPGALAGAWCGCRGRTRLPRGPLCELLFEADMDRSSGFCSQPRLLPSEPGGEEGGGHP